MKIILTSFRDAQNWNGTKCSIARWQPDWSTMPEFPIDVKPIYKGQKLTEYMSPAEYKQKYNLILREKGTELIKFFSRIEDDETIILCCWCNLDRQKGSKLFCHRILLGYWIEAVFKYPVVIYADGAEKPIWERSK